MSEKRLYAVRGATSAESNDAGEILASTRELMEKLMDENSLQASDMVSCLFTCTGDLDAEFPAVAARGLGLNSVPLLCMREIDVEGALERCVRVLVHYYGDSERKPKHIYLKDARKLRSDLNSAQ